MFPASLPPAAPSLDSHFVPVADTTSVAQQSDQGTVVSNDGDDVLFEMPYFGGSAAAAGQQAAEQLASQLGVDPATITVSSVSMMNSTALVVLKQSQSVQPPAASGPGANTASISDWVMVVPATIELGGIPLWDRTSEWAKSWITPVSDGSGWLVGVAGDSADVSNVTAAYLTSLNSAGTPQLQPISYLYSKYSPRFVDVAIYDPKSGYLQNYFFTPIGLAGSDSSMVANQQAGVSTTESFVSDQISNIQAQVAGGGSGVSSQTAPSPQAGAETNLTISENVMGAQVELPHSAAISNLAVSSPGFSISK